MRRRRRGQRDCGCKYEVSGTMHRRGKRVRGKRMEEGAWWALFGEEMDRGAVAHFRKGPRASRNEGRRCSWGTYSGERGELYSTYSINFYVMLLMTLAA